MVRNTRAARARVAFLARHTSGGAANMLRLWAESLDPEKYQLAAIFHTIRHPDFAAALQAAGVEVISLTPPWRSVPPVFSGANVSGRLAAYPWLRAAYQTVRATQGAAALDLRWQLNLARHLRRLRPSLVHCNNGLRAHRLDILVCSALGIPVICHMHGFEQLTDLERLAARRVWGFAHISRAVAADFERQGLPAHRGVLIPEALPAAALIVPEPVPRTTFGCGPEHFVVANVGRLVRWKGQDVFLRAIARIAPRLPHLRAWVVGGADDNEPSRAFAAELRQLAETLGIARQVVFTGHRPDALRVMAAADVVVHSSATPEPFGLVLVEAMAVGRPLIATNAGGVLDIVEPGLNALLVPPGDDAALADSLERLAGDPALRARLGAAGRRHVETHFTAQEHMAMIEALYQQCLEGHPAPSETFGLARPVPALGPVSSWQRDA